MYKSACLRMYIYYIHQSLLIYDLSARWCENSRKTIDRTVLSHTYTRIHSKYTEIHTYTRTHTQCDSFSGGRF